MNPGKLHSYLSADRPIATASEDQFGRTRFAQAIAKAIRGWTGQDSLVMALYGPWGVGKTSVKNLILEALSADVKPQVLEFNPWVWSGHDQIQKAFFQELSSLLRGADTSQAGRRRAEQLERYAAMLEGVALNDSFTRVGELVAAFVGVLTLEKASQLFELPSWLQSVLTVIAVALGVLVFAATFFRWIFLGVSKFLRANHGEGNSLEETRAALRKSLKDLGKPVLIVMDDIDRLTNAEIGQVFQLVKVNADFPNLVFVMLFDRSIVEKSLEEITKGDPGEYLEKIVQTSFNVPPASRTELDNYTLERIEAICTHEHAVRRFDKGDVMNAYYGGVRQYIQDLRDAKRYLGSLAVHVAVFHGDDAFEVNPRDLVLLETLRVFEASLYDGISQAKDILVPETQRSREEHAVATLMSNAKSKQEAAREIMGMLFPNQGKLFGKNDSDPGSFAERWFKESRICHPQVFDRYFQLGIPSGDVSQSEIEYVLGLTGDRERFVQVLEGFKRRGIFPALMDRLDNYKTDVSPDHAVPFLAALFDVGEQLDDARNWIGSERSISRIAYFYLRERVPPAIRATEFTHALQLSPESLYTPMKLLLWCQKNDEHRHPEVLSETEAQNLRSVILHRIEQAATSGALLEHQQRVWIFYRWADWTSHENVGRWMRQQLTDRGAFSRLLTSFYSQMTSTPEGSFVSHITTYIDLEGLEAFVPRDEVLAAWSGLNIPNPTPEEVALLQAIRNAKPREQL